MTTKAYVWVDSINLKKGVSRLITGDAADAYAKLQSCSNSAWKNCHAQDLNTSPSIYNVREDPYVIPRHWEKFHGSVYQLTANSINDRFQFTVMDKDYGADQLIGTTANW